MRTEEFVLNELKESFINEANNCFRAEELVLVKTKIDKSISKEALKDIVLIEKIAKDKQLAKLKYSISTLLTINDVNVIFDDFDHEIFPIKMLLDQIIKKKSDNPKNRIFPYFWVKTSVRYFKIEEYFESEIVAFYKEFFENYDYLLDLDDIEYETDYPRLPSGGDIYSNIELTKVFEKAVEKYQNNLTLIFLLIYFYGAQNKMDKAEIEVHKYLNSLPERYKRFEYEDYKDREHNTHLAVLQALAVIKYDSELYDEALNAASLLLDNLIYTEVVGIKRDIRGFEQSLFIRVTINLKRHNKKALEADYKLIREVHTCLDYSDLKKPKYKDAIEYLDYKGMLDDLG